MLKRFSVLLCVFSLVFGSFATTGLAQDRDRKIVIPEGTEIQLSLAEPLSSKLNEPGDQVLATIRRDVIIDGRTLLKQGTEVFGRVTLAEPAKRPLKGGRLHITFEKVRMEGQEEKLAATIKSASDFTRDEKVKSDSEGTLKGGVSGGDALKNIGTAAGLGGIGVTIAVLSSVRERGPSGVSGIGAGGAMAGVGIMGGSVIVGLLLTKGKEVRLDQNAIVRLKLERPLSIE